MPVTASLQPPPSPFKHTVSFSVLLRRSGRVQSSIAELSVAFCCCCFVFVFVFFFYKVCECASTQL